MGHTTAQGGYVRPRRAASSAAAEAIRRHAADTTDESSGADTDVSNSKSCGTTADPDSNDECGEPFPPLTRGSKRRSTDPDSRAAQRSNYLVQCGLTRKAAQVLQSTTQIADATNSSCTGDDAAVAPPAAIGCGAAHSTKGCATCFVGGRCWYAYTAHSVGLYETGVPNHRDYRPNCVLKPSASRWGFRCLINTPLPQLQCHSQLLPITLGSDLALHTRLSLALQPLARRSSVARQHGQRIAVLHGHCNFAQYLSLDTATAPRAEAPPLAFLADGLHELGCTTRQPAARVHRHVQQLRTKIAQPRLRTCDLCGPAR